MTTEPEQVLEGNLISQLVGLGYKLVHLKTEEELLKNLKLQLEKHNNTQLSELEFQQVLNKISKGNIFERAKILRDKVDFTKDTGETGYLELINQVQWCRQTSVTTNSDTPKIQGGIGVGGTLTATPALS